MKRLNWQDKWHLYGSSRSKCGSKHKATRMPPVVINEWLRSWLCIDSYRNLTSFRIKADGSLDMLLLHLLHLYRGMPVRTNMITEHGCISQSPNHTHAAITSRFDRVTCPWSLQNSRWNKYERNKPNKIIQSEWAFCDDLFRTVYILGFN